MTEQNQETQTATQEQTPTGEQTAAQTVAPVVTQPTIEDLQKELEEVKGRYTSSVKEMNEKQRRTAELEHQLDQMKWQVEQLAVAAAAANRPKDIFADIDSQIREAESTGDEMRAVKLRAEKATLLAEARTLQNSVNSVKTIVAAHSPNLKPEEKEALNRELYIDGDPRRGFRDLATVERFLSDPDGAIEAAKDRAAGRKARSGTLQQEWESERQAAERKRQEDIKRQSSVTQPGGGAPVATPTAEEKKKFDEDFINQILNARRP